MKQVLLVDDHPVFLAGLAHLINADSGFTVCGMAGAVNEACALVESKRPDLIVTDLNLPGRNGLELIKDLGLSHPEIPVIVLSMHDETIYAERVLRAGGRGYLMKDAPPERMMEAVRIVAEGGIFTSQAVAQHLLQALTPRSAATPAFPLQRLTDREMEVLELIGQAKSNSEIASQLHISIRTLDVHRSHLRKKLNLKDGNKLTRYAISMAGMGTLSR